MGAVSRGLLPSVLAVLAIGLAACSDSEPAVAVATPTFERPTGTIQVVAPIDDIQVEASDADKPEYIAIVTSGQPSACHRYDGHQVTRENGTVRIELMNRRPADTSIQCSQVYGTTETRITLGRDFEPEVTYSVVVNEASASFAAHPDLGRDDVRGQVGEVVELGLGKRLFYGPQWLLLTFTGATSDSRCPAGVTCIHAGEASVTLEVKRDGQADGSIELILDGGDESKAVKDFDGLKLKILDLVPYPGTPEYGTTSSISIGLFEPGVVPELGTRPPTAVIGRPADYGEEIELAIGDTVLYEVDGVSVSFLEVAEDSRCPADAVCVAAGRAEVAVGVSIRDKGLDNVGLVIGESGDGSVATAGDDLFVYLKELAPYPGTFEGTPNYRVTIVVAQSQDDLPPPRARAQLNEPVTLEVGGRVLYQSERLELHFLDVAEDSRCPANVVCIRAGDAKVVVGIVQEGRNLGEFEVVLGADDKSLATVSFGALSLGLTALEPYPGTITGEVGRTATFVLFAGEQAPEPDKISVDLEESFALGLGDTAIVVGPRIELTFAEVVGESRCPVNVTCIWAGEVTILLSARDGAGVEQSLEMVLGGSTGSAFTVGVGDHFVTLTDVSPYPGTYEGEPVFEATLVVTDVPPVDRNALSGGVLATFQVVEEQFRLWTTAEATIEQLLAMRTEGTGGFPLGTIREGPGVGAHNSPWSWHFDPQELAIAEFAIELCDGLPSHLEGDLSYWLGTVAAYCPWSAKLVELEDFRSE